MSHQFVAFTEPLSTFPWLSDYVTRDDDDNDDDGDDNEVGDDNGSGHCHSNIVILIRRLLVFRNKAPVVVMFYQWILFIVCPRYLRTIKVVCFFLENTFSCCRTNSDGMTKVKPVEQ